MDRFISIAFTILYSVAVAGVVVLAVKLLWVATRPV
jgi:hypothetical protein